MGNYPQTSGRYDPFIHSCQEREFSLLYNLPARSAPRFAPLSNPAFFADHGYGWVWVWFHL